VPRETRRQRRDARRTAGESARPRPVPVPAGGATETAVEHVGAPRRRGRFVHESVAELRKVEWPTRQHVIQGTVAVIVACLIVGAYLWGVDQVLRPFVRDVLLGQ
jgi:preprotein translocase subunit SecE